MNYRLLILCTDNNIDGIRSIASETESLKKGWGIVSQTGEPTTKSCLPVPCSADGEIEATDNGIVYPIDVTHWLTSYVFSGDDIASVNEIAELSVAANVWVCHESGSEDVIDELSSERIRFGMIDKDDFLAEFSLKTMETIVYT